jgi:hypothetical protein
LRIARRGKGERRKKKIRVVIVILARLRIMEAT